MVWGTKGIQDALECVTERFRANKKGSSLSTLPLCLISDCNKQDVE